MIADVAERKRALRQQFLASRRSMAEVDRGRADHSLRQHIRSTMVQLQPAVVAAYIPTGTEPLACDPVGQMTNPDQSFLPELLRSAATQTGRIEPRILLPIWCENHELDWADYRGVDSLVVSQRGLWEPSGRRLGLSQICQADLVLVPALAVDFLGHRLGRGAGCYDRSLTRSRATRVAVTYDHEFVDELPHQAHDVQVNVVITPSGQHPMQ